MKVIHCETSRYNCSTMSLHHITFPEHVTAVFNHAGILLYRKQYSVENHRVALPRVIFRTAWKTLIDKYLAANTVRKIPLGKHPARGIPRGEYRSDNISRKTPRAGNTSREIQHGDITRETSRAGNTSRAIPPGKVHQGECIARGIPRMK